MNRPLLPLRPLAYRATVLFAVLAGVLSCLSPSAAAVAPDQFPLPSALTHQLDAAALVEEIAIPELDWQAIIAEDRKREADAEPPRYAIAHAVFITPQDAGHWERLDARTLVWRLRISSPKAKSINLGFVRYRMPAGARLHLCRADLKHRIRPFTAADNETHGQLWTPPVDGAEAVLELTIPERKVRELTLTLSSINVGYRRFGTTGMGDGVEKDDGGDGGGGGIASGACNVDVACPEGDPWSDEIATVGVISTGGSTFCTGFMVNNTANDRTPYFMTANHCGVNAGNAASLVVFWNYENSTCRPVGSPASGEAGDGTLTDFQTGSFFRSSYSPSDFTLVELDDDPDPDWAVNYAGWARTPGEYNPPSGACIHHPSTDEKRITFYDIAVRPDRPTHGSSWGCSAFPGPGDNSHIKVYWSLGVTEPGSSGSPLFDNNHRVIGQLHGGLSSCSQSGDGLSDCYGRFSLSWTGGGTNATRLSNWLDAGNTGATSVDTLGQGVNVSPSGDVRHVGVVGGPFTPASVQYTLTNDGATSANYEVRLVAGGTAPLLLNGGNTTVGGSLATGASTNVTVSLDSSASLMAAGVYATTVEFADLTNGITSSRVHTLEIGQVGFTVTPAGGLSSGGPVGGPFNTTQIYTLTSTRPTPVTVEVAAGQSWISINGGSGPLQFNLNGTGASANVTIGYSSAANSLPNGLHNGTVTFTNTGSGGAASDTSRPVTLDVGRYVYPASGLPLPINDNQTTTSNLTVADSYCIADVDLAINIQHTYIGDLVVELRSPAGTVVRLHNRTGGGADNIVGTYDDEGPLDPDGPGALADFDGQQVSGTWTLTVADQAGSDTGSLVSWSLRVAASATPCAPPQVVYSWNLETNPGWTTMGQWAWGDPTGGGTHNHDPNTGFTGTNVYGYNLNGDYPNFLSPTQYLTTSAINCASLTGVKLRFKRWLGVESATWDHANIQISTNGSTWTNVWNHTGSTISEATWSTQTYNISATADGQATVYLRWGMGTTDGSVTYPGWNIDDIEILADAEPCPADINGDNVIDVNDLLALIGAWGPCGPPCPADINGDGVVDVNDLLALIGAWGAC